MARPVSITVIVSAEYARLLRTFARRYRCDVETLLEVAVTALVETAPTPRRRRQPTRRSRPPVIDAAVEAEKTDGRTDGAQPVPSPAPGDEFDTVWNGGEGLTSYQQRRQG